MGQNLPAPLQEGDVPPLINDRLAATIPRLPKSFRNVPGLGQSGTSPTRGKASIEGQGKQKAA